MVSRSPWFRQHPGIEIEVVVGNTEAISKAIIECRIDVRFVEGWVDDPRVVASLWKHEPLQFVVPADSPLGVSRAPTIAELNRQTWLLRESGSGTRQVAQALLAARGIRPPMIVEIGSNEAIAQTVASGTGMAVLPAAVVADLIAVKRLRAVRIGKDQQLTRPLYRVEFANRPRSPALQVFLDLVGHS